MAEFGIVGNIARDDVMYRNGHHYSFVGGGAFHIAMAAARSRQQGNPISVIGNDLAWITKDPRFAALNLRHVLLVDGPSCHHSIKYDDKLRVENVSHNFGVSLALTAHALNFLDSYPHYHICCRHPLNVGLVLEKLVERQLSFSLDFHISSARQKILEALPWLRYAIFLFINAQELKILSEYTPVTELGAVLVTNGGDAVQLLSKGISTISMKPATAVAKEVTGAGDVLVGTFLSHWVAGVDCQIALRRAIDAATTWVTRDNFDVINFDPHTR